MSEGRSGRPHIDAWSVHDPLQQPSQTGLWQPAACPLQKPEPSPAVRPQWSQEPIPQPLPRGGSSVSGSIPEDPAFFRSLAILGDASFSRGSVTESAASQSPVYGAFPRNGL